MKNMPINRGKKVVFKSQGEEEWLWTVYLSLVWWKRTYPPSAIGLWFWAPTSNALSGWMSPASFPSFQPTGNALCTPRALLQRLWSERNFVNYWTVLCRAFSWGDLSQNIHHSWDGDSSALRLHPLGLIPRCQNGGVQRQWMLCLGAHQAGHCHSSACRLLSVWFGVRTLAWKYRTPECGALGFNGSVSKRQYMPGTYLYQSH